MSNSEEIREAMFRPKNNRIVSVISQDKDEQEIILETLLTKAAIIYPHSMLARATDTCEDERPRPKLETNSY